MTSQILAALGLLACLAFAGLRLLQWWKARRPARPLPAPEKPAERTAVEWEGNVARPDFSKRRDKRTLH